MLFNSYAFLLVFLPVAFGGFAAFARAGAVRGGIGWLTLASLAFYGAWNPRFVALLAVSIVFNFAMARAIARHAQARRGGALLASAVAVNLLLLGVFKYANFFVDTVASVSGAVLPAPHLVLPVGISFFTFTQIAFLVDVRRGLASDLRFVRYALFVTWFPHLVAGPVIHHAQVMPQFDSACARPPRAHDLSLGLALFALGLAKKVLLADAFGEHATPVFEAAAHGHALGMLAAWSGALAYTLQLYFDFSGYSDMACGLSRLFGVRLPVNFDSPYKAWNIIEFWRRWHITLSRFLRDYLYVPLGGNRRGAARRYLNLMITMLLGGLWHGANWTFVAWGGAHGAMLLVNHAWHALRRRLGIPYRGAASGVGRVLGTTLTFALVVLAWVPFRASDFASARRVLAAMADVASLPSLAQLGTALGAWPVRAADRCVSGLPPSLSDIQGAAALPLLAAGVLIVMFLPNAAQIAGPRAAFGARAGASRLPAHTGSRWRPGAAWAIAVGALLGVALLNLSRVSPFLYFQF